MITEQDRKQMQKDWGNFSGENSQPSAKYVAGWVAGFRAAERKQNANHGQRKLIFNQTDNLEVHH